MHPASSATFDQYRSRPSLLVILDDEEKLQQVRDAAAAADVRLLGPVRIADAERHLDSMVGCDAVLLAVTSDRTGTVTALLDRLERDAAEGRSALIVLLPVSEIDVVAARAGSAQLLCEPEIGELQDAIAGAVVPRDGSLSDVGRESNTLKLRQLSEEVGRIARTLASLSTPAGMPPDTPIPDVVPGETDAGAIRAMIRLRRMREQFFRENLFADPAWDILLDLMAARIERRHVAVSSLCIAAAVPPTTALRHIKSMTDEGLLVRVSDPRDGRRVFIELSDAAAAAMSSFLSALRRVGGHAV